jgi:hypothetical protein
LEAIKEGEPGGLIEVMPLLPGGLSLTDATSNANGEDGDVS